MRINGKEAVCTEAGKGQFGYDDEVHHCSFKTVMRVNGKEGVCTEAETGQFDSWV